MNPEDQTDPQQDIKPSSCQPLFQQVCDELRRHILAGNVKPGKKLPTFDVLEKHFGTSRTVVQQAIARLKTEGFIYSVNRRGLFVTENPPHLNRYGLLIAPLPSDPQWTRFDTALINEARILEVERPDCEIVIFTGMAHDRGSKFMQRLRHDVTAHRMAGLLLTQTLPLENEPPFNSPEIPKVYICRHPNSKLSPIIATNGPQMAERVLALLKARNCARLAIIRLADDSLNKLTLEMARRAGFVCQGDWVQVVERPRQSETIPAFISKLAALPAEQRPDGLIIADDNLVEYVAASLVATQLHVGQDINIVAHCNWPWPIPSILPMQRIGYHAGELLQRCIEAVDMQRRGETPPPLQLIPARTEEEAARVSIEYAPADDHEEIPDDDSAWLRQD